MDLHEFLVILRARWRFMALVTVVGALVTAYFALATPPSYASSATLLVSPPASGVLDPYGATQTAQQRAESYATLATDAELLQRAAARLNLGLTGSDLAGSVSASVIPDTLLLQVNVVSGSPELAQQIATVVSDEIIRMVKELETPSDSNIPAPIVARLGSKATLNKTPIAPNIPLNIGAGLLLTLFVALAGAFVRDRLDTSIRTSEDVEGVAGSAPMGVLPYSPTVRDVPLTSDELSRSLNEALRVLRTNLKFASLDSTRQTILVTSSVPEEGKTLVATNLAVAMATGGNSVLLLDADMRNPNVAGLLGLDNSAGLINVLLGRATIEQVTQHHGSRVDFIGTGPQPPNPSEVLDTNAMRELIGRLREMYDVVIIDAPPLLPVADAAILVTEVDGALLLVRYGGTRREQLRQAISRLNAVGGRLLGLIINQAPERTVGGQYGYGYGYGYGALPSADRETKVQGRRRR